MAEDNRFDLSRRSLLKRGAIATGVTTFGLSTVPGTALATECPKTPGFWANKDWCEVSIDSDDPDANSVAEAQGYECFDGEVTGTYAILAPPSGDGVGPARTMEQWQDFLTAPVRGDKGKKMAQVTLATALNFARRGNPDPDCVDKKIDLSRFGLGETSIRCVTIAAKDWLQASDWPDEKQETWRVDSEIELKLGCFREEESETGTDDDVGEYDTMIVGGESLKDALDAFNNGNLDLDCSCRKDGGDGNKNDEQGEDDNHRGGPKRGRRDEEAADDHRGRRPKRGRKDDDEEGENHGRGPKRGWKDEEEEGENHGRGPKRGRKDDDEEEDD